MNKISSGHARRPRGVRGEVLACGFGLGLITVLMCAVHIRNGGFYYDDWSVLALGRFPPPGGLLPGLWLDYGQRPGQALYYAALDEGLGSQAGPRLALAAVMVALEATCLYALLRRLGLAVRHAAAIAALLLTFPFSDSVWLWGILSLTSLAIAGALLGVILALRALESSSRARARALHVASLALYVASIASYEVFAVAGCLAGLLYVRTVGFRRARTRWALDILAIGATLAFVRVALPIDIATPSRTQSLAGMATHAGSIAVHGMRLAGAAALPAAGDARRGSEPGCSRPCSPLPPRCTSASRGAIPSAPSSGSGSQSLASEHWSPSRPGPYTCRHPITTRRPPSAPSTA